MTKPLPKFQIIRPSQSRFLRRALLDLHLLLPNQTHQSLHFHNNLCLRRVSFDRIQNHQKPPTIPKDAVCQCTIDGFGSGKLYLVSVIPKAALVALDLEDIKGQKIQGWFEGDAPPP
jgi:hypothetical protein